MRRKLLGRGSREWGEFGELRIAREATEREEERVGEDMSERGGWKESTREEMRSAEVQQKGLHNCSHGASVSGNN